MRPLSPMNERDLLLRGVCESPDDDTPRLVFADWLDENGEPERAEFIRLQCGFQSPTARQSVRDEDAGCRFCRMTILRELYRCRWLAELPTVGRPGEVVWQNFFFRGFVARLDVLDWSLLKRYGEELMSASPVSHLGIRRAAEVNGGVLRRLMTPRFRGVRFVSLGFATDPHQVAIELLTIEQEYLYRQVSVQFVGPSEILSSTTARRVEMLNRMAQKHGHRIEIHSLST